MIVAGIAVAILDKNEPAPVKVEIQNALDKVGANQLGWMFFEDSNANGEFDYSEKVFNNVSVALRRPGETNAFLTMPAEVNGLVKIDGLTAGIYEVQYLNYELEQPYAIGEWLLKRYYQIIESGKTRYSFLPTEWERIELTSAGFKVKVGLREYQPAEVLVIKEGKQVKFYDPAREMVLGQSQWADEAERQFYLKDDQVYFVNEKKLWQFNFKDKFNTLVGEALAEEDKNIQGLFYSDDSGSYFYDRQTKKRIKYTALGSNAKAVVSEDEKYIGARLNANIMVVDYPAVMASGVEKHYVLPFSGQFAFSGDDVLINQSQEIVRVELKGDGVWEIKDRIELKDIQADEILGEIRLN